MVRVYYITGGATSVVVATAISSETRNDGYPKTPLIIDDDRRGFVLKKKIEHQTNPVSEGLIQNVRTLDTASSNDKVRKRYSPWLNTQHVHVWTVHRETTLDCINLLFVSVIIIATIPPRCLYLYSTRFIPFGSIYQF
jgi:hypothetical protein